LYPPPLPSCQALQSCQTQIRRLGARGVRQGSPGFATRLAQAGLSALASFPEGGRRLCLAEPIVVSFRVDFQRAHSVKARRSVLVPVLEKNIAIAEPLFDHDRRNVDHLSTEYPGSSFDCPVELRKTTMEASSRSTSTARLSANTRVGDFRARRAGVFTESLFHVEGRFARLPPPSHQQILPCGPCPGGGSRFLFSLFVLFRYDSPALADAMFRGR